MTPQEHRQSGASCRGLRREMSNDAMGRTRWICLLAVEDRHMKLQRTLGTFWEGLVIKRNVTLASHCKQDT
jgi:hypothetical protein